jgi:hypothetical protein
VFTQVATSTAADIVIDNSLTNGDPNAILIVTPNLNPAGGSAAAGVYDGNPIGVWYDGAHWEIFHENGAAMTVGAAYNVLVIKP